MRMQRKGRVAIIGNGLNKVDFTSVHNLNEALLSAVRRWQGAGQAYNISNGQPVPLWDVVNYVMRQMQCRRSPATVPAWPTAWRRSTRRLACCGQGARNRPCRAWACR
jgi:nucleoside-diphosphate-sugar epimerase